MREDDEMVDQAFHVPHHVRLGRRDDLGRVRDDGTLGHLIQTLGDDAAALAHLLHPHPVAVVGVAVLADRHLPLDLAVGAVRLQLPHVVGDSGGPEHRPGEAEVDGVLGRNDRHVPGAADPDPVRLEQLVILLDVAGKGGQEGLQPLDQIRREVAVHPADTEVVERQPGAAELLEHIQQHFALPERPEEDGHGADVQGLGPQPEEMPDDPLHLGHDRPDIFGPLGDLQVQQLLHRPDVGVVVRHRADVIQPVRVGNDLHVGQPFGQLFHPPVQIAQIGRRLDDPFAVQFEHDPQHPVGRRVLRPHVQQQLFGPAGRGAGLGHKHLLLLLRDFPGDAFHRRLVQPRDELEPAAPAPALGGEVLPQRMPLVVVLRHQDPPQVGVAAERDAHEVVDLALQEIGPLPDAGERGDRRIVLGHPRLDPDSEAVREREEVVDHFEAVLILRIVGRTDVGDVVEGSRGIVMEEGGHLQQAVGGHAHGELPALLVLVDRQNGLEEAGFQCFKQRVHGFNSSQSRQVLKS